MAGPGAADFLLVLDAPAPVDLERLRCLARQGVPRDLRGRVWKLLLQVPALGTDSDPNDAYDKIDKQHSEYARRIHSDVNRFIQRRMPRPTSTTTSRRNSLTAGGGGDCARSASSNTTGNALRVPQCVRGGDTRAAASAYHYYGTSASSRRSNGPKTPDGSDDGSSESGGDTKSTEKVDDNDDDDNSQSSRSTSRSSATSHCSPSHAHAHNRGRRKLAPPFVIDKLLEPTYNRVINAYLNAHPHVEYNPAYISIITPLVVSMDSEIDIYHCFSHLINDIHEYSKAHPINARVAKFVTLFRRALPDLFNYFQEEEVDLGEWVSSWLLNLLAKELPLESLVYLWDYYLAQGTFLRFHTFVCLAILHCLQQNLEELEQSEIRTVLLRLPPLDISQVIPVALTLQHEVEQSSQLDLS
ncbi:hypothetical protein H4R35_001892 [Dimargaris xerosporica]|nr:hypothetical protein H4R35_001892 [Dimargaris xerosporica]